MRGHWQEQRPAGEVVREVPVEVEENPMATAQ